MLKRGFVFVHPSVLRAYLLAAQFFKLERHQAFAAHPANRGVGGTAGAAKTNHNVPASQSNAVGGPRTAVTATTATAAEAVDANDNEDKRNSDGIRIEDEASSSKRSAGESSAVVSMSVNEVPSLAHGTHEQTP